MIKTAGWIIDLGPKGGDGGGEKACPRAGPEGGAGHAGGCGQGEAELYGAVPGASVGEERSARTRKEEGDGGGGVEKIQQSWPSEDC